MTRSAALAIPLFSLALTGAPSSLAGQQPANQLPAAIFTDPARDSAHPARMVVLHIPTGAVRVNGVAYVPAGAGLHPTLVLLHGLPGNEKNLDLAQAVRRAGWTVVTFNYRGSWGSPGSFRFAQNLEDADAAIAYLRDTANARALQVDAKRIVLAGHSMGGWVTALTASHQPELRGAILISGADMGAAGRGGRAGPTQRAQGAQRMRGMMESLAGVTAEEMADELIANADRFEWTRAAPGLARLPLLVLTADDGLAPAATALADSVRAHGGRVSAVHVATDHSWSDRRIELQALVLRWLAQLP
ncbi:MAG TPA: alpha/beta hydrolase [Longimicrobiales bacterium]